MTAHGRYSPALQRVAMAFEMAWSGLSSKSSDIRVKVQAVQLVSLPLKWLQHHKWMSTTRYTKHAKKYPQ